MNNLFYYKDLQGVMTQFEPLTEAALQKVDADGLAIPEIKNALEQRGKLSWSSSRRRVRMSKTTPQIIKQAISSSFNF